MSDFDYEQMLKGEFYLGSGISGMNRSVHGKMLAQQMNQLPDDTETIIK